MKKLLLLSILLVSSFTYLASQEENFEIGIRATNFESFGSIIKIQNKNGNFQRFRLASGNSRINLADQSNSLGLRASFAYGIEKRKEINEKVFFFHGFEPFISISAFFNQESSLSTSLGLGYVLGLQYRINDDFSFALESIPSLRGNFNLLGTSTSSNLELGFNSNAIALSFLYRFTRKS